jgi:cysteine desulfurase / selenocysteine lyase
MVRYYKEYRANVHRGMYKESECATREYELARKKIAAFIGADPREIMFTSGATASANMLYRSLEESGLSAEGNVITSVFDHHAQFVTLQELARRAHLEFRVGKTMDEVAELCDASTRIIGVPLASNVTGEIFSFDELLKAKGQALLVVDATAAVGHIPVDVKTLGCDALYFSGHKMFGPTGVGVLWVRQELLEKLRPSTFGGHMVSRVEESQSEWASIPERFEAGTLNIAGVIGLGKAVEYLSLLKVSEIHEHAKVLIKDGVEALAAYPEVTIYAASSEKNVGIIPFTIKGIHPHDIAEVFARHNVKVRAGHHCAMPLHASLGVSSTVRVSLHAYSSREDIEMLVKAVEDVINIFKP